MASCTQLTDSPLSSERTRDLLRGPVYREDGPYVGALVARWLHEGPRVWSWLDASRTPAERDMLRYWELNMAYLLLRRERLTLLMDGPRLIWRLCWPWAPGVARYGTLSGLAIEHVSPVGGSADHPLCHVRGKGRSLIYAERATTAPPAR